MPKQNAVGKKLLTGLGQNYLKIKKEDKMTGTKEGAKKTVKTILSRHGKDFYKRIGKKGGENGHEKGFFLNRELAREAGRKGGKRSKRRKAKKDNYEDERVSYQSY